MRVDCCRTYNNSKSEWHIYVMFIFVYVKIFMQSTFIYTVDLLKPNLFQSYSNLICFKAQMTMGVQLGLDTQ